MTLETASLQQLWVNAYQATVERHGVGDPGALHNKAVQAADLFIAAFSDRLPPAQETPAARGPSLLRP